MKSLAVVVMKKYIPIYPKKQSRL